MRLTFIIDSLKSGGTEMSTALLLPALEELGIATQLVQLVDRGGFAEDLRRDGLAPMSLTSVSRSGRLRELRNLLRRTKPDLIHSQLFEADILGRLAAGTLGIPIVSSWVTLSYGRADFAALRPIPRLKLAHALLADISTVRTARRIHAVSHTVAAVMSHRLRVPMRKIDVVPRGRNGTALGRRTEARRVGVRRAMGIPEGMPVILAVARHEPVKGLDILLEAAARTAPRCPVRLLIAGSEGTATGSLQRLANELRRSPWEPEFLGFRRDIADLMSVADLLVFPSRVEGLPGTLIEALALEVPMVVSDLCQNMEVVGGLPGVAAFEAGSSLELARVLAEVLDGASDAPTEHRQRFKTRYELEAVALQMRRLYEKALD